MVKTKISDKSKKKKFSQWVRWDEREQLEGITFPGIYALAKTRKRISGELFSYRKDIIYIGMTNSIGGLKSRLCQFERAMDPNKSGHGGAKRFLFRFPDFSKVRKNLYVAISYTECAVSSNNPDDLLKMGEVAKQEYECWAAYAKLHNRLPRFNDKKRSPKKAD